MSGYSDWLVFTDLRYRMVYTADWLAHKLLGDGDLRWPGLCNLERRMYYRRQDRAAKNSLMGKR